MTTLMVGTDGSDLATQAASAGLSLTKPPDKVLVVFVVDDSSEEEVSGFAGPTMTPHEIEASEREGRAEGQAVVEATVEALRDATSVSADFETRVSRGPAGPELCRVAADVGASALIIGSHGRGGLKRALLGSVSDYIVRHAPCPVVISRKQ
jgi:nucleotide-binding universal stress UspA family protein